MNDENIQTTIESLKEYTLKVLGSEPVDWDPLSSHDALEMWNASVDFVYTDCGTDWVSTQDNIDVQAMMEADDKQKAMIVNKGLAPIQIHNTLPPFYIKVMSEDPMDDRLLLNGAGGILLHGVSRLDGRPIFKVADGGDFEKIREMLSEIGEIRLTDEE